MKKIEKELGQIIQRIHRVDVQADGMKMRSDSVQSLFRPFQYTLKML